MHVVPFCFCAGSLLYLCVSSWQPGAGVVQERSAIPEEYHWDLEAIYPSLDAWEKSFKNMESKVKELASYAGRLVNPETLLEYIKADEAVCIELGRLYVYAGMKSHEDLRETKAMELASRAESLLARYSEATAFFDPEIMALPEEQVRQWLETPDLKLYSFHFEEVLRTRPHVLSLELEALLASMHEISAVPDNAFSLLSNADLKFPNIKDENGQEVQVTDERWYLLSRSPNRAVRQAAFESLYGTYDSFKNAFSALYGGSVKSDQFYAKTRHYKSCLDRALFDEDVPMKVYDNVTGTAMKYAPLLHRLINLKKRALDLDTVHYYDLSVPLAPESLREISFEDACDLAIKALSPLGEDYIANFKRALSDRWIDVYENVGKRSGAYSWGSYGTHPYVLMNYNGTLRDVFTLVHEMGHSLHSWYSHQNQPYVYGNYTILLAEVASTTNEALLLGYLLQNSTSEAERKWLMDYYYEMVRTTFFRQAMFADFERQTHTHAETGGVLTPDWLHDLWGRLNTAYYGSEFTVDPALCAEWARIPHFYSAFYVYKYATGFTAANAFASAILNQEPGAVERYLTFLKSGGSDWSLDILKRAGVDLTSNEPFERTMKLFSDRLDEGEKLFFSE